MILLTGANGVVGYAVQQKLAQDQYISVSRQDQPSSLQWDMEHNKTIELPPLKQVIHCAPIWLLVDHMQLLFDSGVRHFIVFSSTSVISKQNSNNASEQALVDRLASAEQSIMHFCQQRDLSLLILRPSMIYGYGRDQNISHIARFISKYGFAIVAGEASGLRQPVHAGDLAELSIQLTKNPPVGQQTYSVAGQDVLTYRAMVATIFNKLNKRPIILALPIWSLRLALSLASRLGRFDYTADMANRMLQDLNYDNQPAIETLDFKPSAFLENPQRDLPDYVA